jgi:hypothetical protein
MLGFAVLLAHVVEGQFDIFWVTASGSIPWILVGMSLGAGAAEPVVPLPGELPPAAFGPGVPGGPVPWVAATRFGASPGPAIPSPGQPAGRPPWSRYPAPRFPMAKYPSVQPRPRRGGAPDAEG